MNRILQIPFSQLDILQLCGKGRVAAVIGPVSIQNPDLCHGRIPFFLVPEIILDKLKIPEGHGKIQRIVQLFQLFLFHPLETVKNFHILRFRKIHGQRFRLLRSGLAGIHRINAVGTDRRHLLLRNLSFNDIGCGRTDQRLLVLLQKGNALNRRICPLIELSRQILHGKDMRTIIHRKLLVIQNVHGRLGKHDMAGSFKNLVADSFYIVTNQYTNPADIGNAHVMPDLMAKLFGSHSKFRFFLHINSSDFAHFLLLVCPRFFRRTKGRIRKCRWLKSLGPQKTGPLSLR